MQLLDVIASAAMCVWAVVHCIDWCHTASAFAFTFAAHRATWSVRSPGTSVCELCETWCNKSAGLQNERVTKLLCQEPGKRAAMLMQLSRSTRSSQLISFGFSLCPSPWTQQRGCRFVHWK